MKEMYKFCSAGYRRKREITLHLSGQLNQFVYRYLKNSEIMGVNPIGGT